MKNKGFKAQALALVMVVLVVASIIGAALFSRMAKEKQASVNEQDSSIALSQVDAVLDYFVGADIKQIETVLGATDDNYLKASNFGTSTPEVTTINDLLTQVGVDSEDISVNEGWCERTDGENSTGQSDTSVTVEYSEPTDFIEYQPGNVLAYNLDGATLGDETPCNLILRFTAFEDYAVFVKKEVYLDTADNKIKEEVTNYCIQNGVGACGTDIPDIGYNDEQTFTFETLSGEVWDPTYIDGGVYQMTIDLNDLLRDANKEVKEVRFLPIKGTLGVSVDFAGNETCISMQCKPIKITAEANCNGSYRGKQMFLPGSGSLGYSTLFDYGIYDSGLFQP